MADVTCMVPPISQNQLTFPKNKKPIDRPLQFPLSSSSPPPKLGKTHMPPNKRRPPGPRKRSSPPPSEKRVSYVILDDDDDDNENNGTRVSMPRGYNVGRSCGVVEPDYQLYLKGLGVCVGNSNENRARVGGGGCGFPMNGDLADVDCDYKLFLGMLRVDRNGYSLELPIADGVSLVMAYEDGGNAAPCNGARALRVDDRKGGDGGRPVNVAARTSRSGSKESKRKSKGVSTGAKRDAGPCRTRQTSQNEEGDVGGHPGLGLEREDVSQRKHVSTQADGGGPIMVKRKANDVSTCIKNRASEPANVTKLGCSHKEPEAAQGNGGPKGTKRKSDNVSAGVKKRASEPLPGKHNNQPSVGPADFRRSEVGHKVKSEVMDALNSPKEEQIKQRNKGKPDPVDIINSPKERQNKQKNKERSDLIDVVNPPPKEQQKGKTDSMDIFNSPKEQQNEQSYSDPDVMILNDNPAKSCTPLVVLDAEDGEVTNVGFKSNFPQDMELIRLLKQPFDEVELKNLTKDFVCRLPVVRSVELRSGPKRFKSDVLGLSYQDRYRDLADKIRSSNEKAKTLNLLRGFFYWMQNLAHGTMLAPWKDPSYLEVLPCSS